MAKGMVPDRRLREIPEMMENMVMFGNEGGHGHVAEESESQRPLKTRQHGNSVEKMAMFGNQGQHGHVKHACPQKST